MPAIFHADELTWCQIQKQSCCQMRGEYDHNEEQGI